MLVYVLDVCVKQMCVCCGQLAQCGVGKEKKVSQCVFVHPKMFEVAHVPTLSTRMYSALTWCV